MSQTYSTADRSICSMGLVRKRESKFDLKEVCHFWPKCNLFWGSLLRSRDEYWGKPPKSRQENEEQWEEQRRNWGQISARRKVLTGRNFFSHIPVDGAHKTRIACCPVWMKNMETLLNVQCLNKANITVVERTILDRVPLGLWWKKKKV